MRSKKGALSALFFVVTCLALMIIGSLGIDVSHAFYARNQLQTAADNAALTGAYYLCTPVPLKPNLIKCDEYARIMAARNVVDGTSVIDDGENTLLTVTPEIRPMIGPNLCHIHIMRNVPTSLARMVGVTSLPISVDSTAGAYITSKSIMPNWLTNLAISWRANTGNLNIDTTDKDNKNNGWIISEWKGSSSPAIKFGVTEVSAGAGDLSSMAPGVLYNVAIVNGGKDEEKMPTNSTVIGSTAIIIKKLDGPKKASFLLVPGSIIKSQPGPWPPNRFTLSKDLEFANMNRQWRITIVR
jgi:hypothetical protein